MYSNSFSLSSFSLYSWPLLLPLWQFSARVLFVFGWAGAFALTVVFLAVLDLRAGVLRAAGFRLAGALRAGAFFGGRLFCLRCLYLGWSLARLTADDDVPLSA